MTTEIICAKVGQIKNVGEKMKENAEKLFSEDADVRKSAISALNDENNAIIIYAGELKELLKKIK